MNLTPKIPEMFENMDKELLARFKTYHLENPHVWDAFKQASFDIQTAGQKKYSAWIIVNKIRWDHDIKANGNAFKINNDFIAIYARLMIHNHPEKFSNFFELRATKSTRRKISREEKKRND